MTKFPELPPIPDPAQPLKTLVTGLNNLVEGMNEVDKVGQEFSKAAKRGRETTERILKRRPLQ